MVSRKQIHNLRGDQQMNYPKIIESVNELSSLSKDEFITQKGKEYIKLLEDSIKDLKEFRSNMIFAELGNEKTKQIGDYKLTKSDRYTKYPEVPIDDIDPAFIKTEKKLDTKAINEFRKIHKKLPEGVAEQYQSTSIRETQIKEKEEKPKVEKIENPLKGIKFEKK